MMNLIGIMQGSPDVPGYGGGKWAMYSVHCCWWTSFPSDLGSTKERGAPFSLPCCPHCGSVLMQAPLGDFVNHAMKNEEHYGKDGIRTFVAAHSRNSSTCHQGWQLYENENDRR